ncbi:hypothetical protein [Sporosarcina trichiuri]|uniref:hypothetical protein n=1 Tax=Sporosarcina trichiuri TaxID=3056445 RepID=UPI0025B4757C|nr:hypothetical protein [Sporosarcina sp. 0.2-SM1T-5]WJY28070.1 hypothetical protein QWT68_03555 [Sporosarcina sp. 0.2-SM1T-5]
MKRIVIILLTMSVEAVILLGLARYLGWTFMETIFLGSLLIFAVPWLFSFVMNHNRNVYYSNVRGMTGGEAGAVRVFRLRISPVMMGLLLSVVVSFVLTLVFYYEEFMGM